MRIPFAHVPSAVARLVVALLIALAVTPIPAAADGPQLSVIDVNTSNFPLVNVTVEATGSDGLPITGLDKPAFTAYENGKPQSLVSGSALESTATPLTVMLALDTSGSMADNGKLQQAKDAASAFVAQMRPIDRIGIIQFDSQLSLASPFTSDTGSLTRVITGLTAQGNTRIYDALYLAFQETAQAEGSRAIVLMTDGKDTESAIDLEHARALLHSTGVRVYAIGVGPDFDQQVLSQIAAESGGRFYNAPTPGDIGFAFRLMSDQLRDRYVVSYRSAGTLARGTKVDLQITARTTQGLASVQTSYITPAILNPSNAATGPLQQPQPRSAAAVSWRSALLASGLVALGILLAAAGLALSQAQRWRHTRLAFFVGGAEQPLEEQRSMISDTLVGMTRVLSGAVTRVVPSTQIESLTRQVALAGSPRGSRVGQVLLAKVLLGSAGVGAGVLFMVRQNDPVRGLVMAAAFGLLGYRLPTFWIKRRVKQRQNAILKTLPDALDLLTICVEAGLGMDGAMLEVINRWNNALSDEFAIVLAELKMGRSRRDALRSLAERTGLQEVTAFTSALIQADELGMGIARPLALQAQQLRIKRKQRAEKLAHEAGIKMVVAMGIFIMPALFMIILSPAVVQIRHMFGGH